MRIFVASVLFLALTACQAPEKFQVAPGIDDGERFGPDPELDAAAWPVGSVVAVSFDAYGTRYVVESSDPAVLSVGFTYNNEETGQLGAFFSAVAPGDADVIAVDDEGIEVDRQSIAVRVPATAALHASGPLTLRMPSEDSLVTRPHVLVNGVSSFEIRWYDDEARRLHAPQDRTVTGTNGWWVETFVQYGRDWVRLQPSGEGQGIVTLQHGDVDIARWDVIGIPSDEVVSVVLLDQETDEDVRSFLAIARNADATAIWGTQFDWSVRGLPIEAQGDVYRYTYDPEIDVELEAAFGDESDVVTLHGTGGPTDSTHLGCNAPLPFPGSAAIGLALLALRRRR